MSSTPEIAVIGVGLHPFGRYTDRSALEVGMFLTTHYFGTKIMRYMHAKAALGSQIAGGLR